MSAFEDAPLHDAPLDGAARDDAPLDDAPLDATALDGAALDAAALALALASAPERPALAHALIARAQAAGVYPASIAPIYRALATGAAPALTVPAMNLRGVTYRVARAAFRTAARLHAGPIIFELAPSEAWAGDMSFLEYAAMIQAAAAREGVRGPVFLQADHVTIDADDPASVAQARAHVQDALDAGFAQLDVDAAALATHAADSATRQARNAAVTAELAAWVRARRPDAVIGGEVGEIGGADTHPDDLRAFLGALARHPSSAQLGKVSVQTGTRHGGVVHADGRSGVMRVDHALAGQLATIARREFGLPGVVQHGASTLTPEQWRSLPAAGVIEVHLATGIQNVILDHPALPAALTAAMQEALVGPVTHAERGSDTAEALTRAQIYRHNRWRAWGTFKRELWSLPEAVWAPIDAALEAWFTTTFTALGVAGRAGELARIPAPA